MNTVLNKVTKWRLVKYSQRIVAVINYAMGLHSKSTYNVLYK